VPAGRRHFPAMPSAEIDPVLRILVAHGDVEARTRLCEEIERAGFLVCAKTANDGEALDAAVRERPDVSVLDAAAGVGAIALAAQIKEALPKRKVVLINAVADEKSVTEAARAGIDGYLPETADLARLPDVIRAVVAGEAAYPRGLLARLLAGLAAPKDAELP
jgi:DNA-binding NarL/FixJ family response regulator